MYILSLYKVEPIEKKKYLFPRPSYFNDGIIIISLNYEGKNNALGEVNFYSGSFDEIMRISKNIFSLIKKTPLSKINLKKIFILLKKSENNLFCLCSCIAAFSQIINSLKMRYIDNVLKTKKKIDTYASGGMIYENQSLELLTEEALKFKDKNFFGWKFRPPFPKNFQNHKLRMLNPPDFDEKKLIKISEKIRLKVGNEFNLMLDFGCRISDIKKYKYIADGLQDLKFLFIEEPVKRNLIFYRKIKKINNKIILAGGEHIYSYQEAAEWTESKNLNYLQFDVNSLSFDDILELKQKFKRFDKTFIPHNWTSSIITSMSLSLLKVFKQKENLIEKNIFNSPFKNLFKTFGYQFLNGSYIVEKKINPRVELNSKNFKYFKINKIDLI